MSWFGEKYRPSQAEILGVNVQQRKERFEKLSTKNASGDGQNPLSPQPSVCMRRNAAKREERRSANEPSEASRQQNSPLRRSQSCREVYVPSPSASSSATASSSSSATSFLCAASSHSSSSHCSSPPVASSQPRRRRSSLNDKDKLEPNATPTPQRVVPPTMAKKVLPPLPRPLPPPRSHRSNRPLSPPPLPPSTSSKPSTSKPTTRSVKPAPPRPPRLNKGNNSVVMSFNPTSIRSMEDHTKAANLKKPHVPPLHCSFISASSSLASASVASISSSAPSLSAHPLASKSVTAISSSTSAVSNPLVSSSLSRQNRKGGPPAPSSPPPLDSPSQRTPPARPPRALSPPPSPSPLSPLSPKRHSLSPSTSPSTSPSVPLITSAMVQPTHYSQSRHSKMYPTAPPKPPAPLSHPSSEVPPPTATSVAPVTLPPHLRNSQNSSSKRSPALRLSQRLLNLNFSSNNNSNKSNSNKQNHSVDNQNAHNAHECYDNESSTNEDIYYADNSDYGVGDANELVFVMEDSPNSKEAVEEEQAATRKKNSWRAGSLASSQRSSRKAFLSQRTSSELGNLASNNEDKGGTDSNDDEEDEEGGGSFSYVNSPPPSSSGLLEVRLWKRNCCVEEFVCTERDYLNDLTVIVNIYLEPLRAKELLPMEDVVAIFGDIEDVLSVSQRLLSALQSAPVDQLPLGSILLEHMSEFEIYGQYLANHWKAINLLKERQQKNAAFRDFMNEMEDKAECRSLDLAAFLIKPCQRVMKYPLLLENIVELTDQSHNDKDALQEATKRLRGLVFATNEKKREEDNYLKMLEIQSCFDWSSDEDFAQFISRNREYLAESTFKVSQDGAALANRKVFLFSDMLVITQHHKRSHRYVPKLCISLEKCIVWNMNDGVSINGKSVENAFSVLQTDNTMKLVFVADSGGRKEAWIIRINECIANTLHNTISALT
ncbi:T-lymphoma invasion and metastasis-inducing protein 2 [Balamuthia mandrillaris]